MAWIHKLSDINAIDRTALCAACGPVKVYPRAGRPNGWRCAQSDKCLHAASKSVRVRRGRSGFTKEEYHNKENEQGGLCAICQQRRPLVGDHNHETGEHRGLLCNQCNCAIGLLQDNVFIVMRASNYLRRYTR